jgi:hypothetical protein
MYLLLAVVFTGSAGSTGLRPRHLDDGASVLGTVRRADHLYDTDQAGMLAVARIAMGWPVFVVTSTVIYLAIRTASRALPRAANAAD